MFWILLFYDYASSVPISEQEPVDKVCKDVNEKYFGKWNHTESGKLCEIWNLHERVYFEDHNYCRNPLDDQEPWCYVSEYAWEKCDVPDCADCSCATYGLGKCEYSASFKTHCVCNQNAVLNQGVCINDRPGNPDPDQCQPGDSCGLGNCAYLRTGNISIKYNFI